MNKGYCFLKYVYYFPPSIDKKRQAKYLRKVHTPIEEKIFNTSTKQIFSVFSKQFREHYGKDFIKIDTTLANITVVLYYFAKDSKFFYAELLRTNLSEPSFEKGLLIIGDFGIGK